MSTFRSSTPTARVAFDPLLRIALLALLLPSGSCAYTPTSVWLTWNVQNLFDASDDPTTLDTVLEHERVTAKLQAIGAVLRTLDPDVVALQEVEHRSLLDQLADEVLVGAGYEHRALVEGNDPRGIDVALLSRWPIVTVTSHRDDRFPLSDGTWVSFSRDALEVSVDVEGALVCVFVVHFRSQIGGNDADEKRLAEAGYVRNLVAQRRTQGFDQVLVAGDLNDTPQSPTLQALLENELLGDLTEHVRPADRWTYHFGGEYQQLDFILATERLAGRAISERSSIAHGPAIERASDHAPVSIAFRH